MLNLILKIELSFGAGVFVRRDVHGIVSTVADLHPDDSRVVVCIGNSKQCAYAARSMARYVTNNRRKLTLPSICFNA